VNETMFAGEDSMVFARARAEFMKQALYSEEAQALLWPFRDTLEDHPRSLGLLNPEDLKKQK